MLKSKKKAKRTYTTPSRPLSRDESKWQRPKIGGPTLQHTTVYGEADERAAARLPASSSHPQQMQYYTAPATAMYSHYPAQQGMGTVGESQQAQAGPGTIDPYDPSGLHSDQQYSCAASTGLGNGRFVSTDPSQDAVHMSSTNQTQVCGHAGDNNDDSCLATEAGDGHNYVPRDPAYSLPTTPRDPPASYDKDQWGQVVDAFDYVKVNRGGYYQTSADDYPPSAPPRGCL